MRILLALISLFFTSSTALAATVSSASNASTFEKKSIGIPANWKTYRTTDPRWSIQYPRGWKPGTTAEIESLGIQIDGFLRGYYSIEMYAPRIIITQEKLKGTVSSQEFSNASRRSVQSLRDYKLLGLEAITTQDGEHPLHIFTAKSDDSNFPSEYFYQVYAVIDDTGFVVTAAIPNKSFSKVLDATVRKILSSIYFRSLNSVKTNGK
jgi:hypothetical protein